MTLLIDVADFIARSAPALADEDWEQLRFDHFGQGEGAGNGWAAIELRST
jgi:hypothetical protein